MTNPVTDYPDLVETKERLMELVIEGCKTRTYSQLKALAGLNGMQVAEIKRGERPMISLERLIAICRKLGHTITVTIDEA